MKATTEMEVKITGGRIVDANMSADGICRLTVEVEARNKEKVVTSEISADPVEVKPEEKLTDVSSKNQSANGIGGYGPGYEDIDDFWQYDSQGCID